MQQRDRYGNTVLHYAASGRNLFILRSALSDEGCDVNAKNSKGETPLHIAFKHGRPENVVELVKNHANPEEKDNAGNTPKDLDKSGV